MSEPRGGVIGVRTRRRSYRCMNQKEGLLCQNKEEEYQNKVFDITPPFGSDTYNSPSWF